MIVWTLDRIRDDFPEVPTATASGLLKTESRLISSILLSKAQHRSENQWLRLAEEQALGHQTQAEHGQTQVHDLLIILFHDREWGGRCSHDIAAGSAYCPK